MTRDSMLEFEEDNKKVARRRDKWPGRWEPTEERGVAVLWESEVDMLRFFDKRQTGELDKRCWLTKIKEAKISDEKQYMLMRRGEMIRLEFIGMRDGFPEEFMKAE